MPRYRDPVPADRPLLVVVVAIMVILAVTVGIIPAVMPARQ